MKGIYVLSFFIFVSNSLFGQQIQEQLKASITYWETTFPTEKLLPLTKKERQKSDSLIAIWRTKEHQFLTEDDFLQFQKNTALLKAIAQIIKTESNTLADPSQKIAMDSLAYISAYFSGFSPSKNNANRAGWWGLPHHVAKKHRLYIDYYTDERLDLTLSTEAFLQYYQHLNSIFNTEKEVHLALLGSPMLVRKVREMENLAPFENLLRSAEHIALFKAQFMALYQSSKGVFKPSAIQPVALNNNISFDSLAVILHTPVSLLKAINPVWSGHFYFANKGSVPLIIPSDRLDIFLDNEVSLYQKSILHAEHIAQKRASQLKALKKNIPDLSKSSQHIYRVKSGDNLGRIAGMYRVKVSQIIAWNNLPGDRINIGQKLVIYTGKKNSQALALEKKSKAKQPKRIIKNGKYIEYTIAEGDTLWSISKQFPGVSVDEIMEWNDIDSNIKPGQHIKIKTESR